MSVYLNSLSGEIKARYQQKMSLIGNVDPYDCKESTFSRDLDVFPNITTSDISNYFIYTKSAYTCEEYKAFKSLNSYVFFKNGWVRDMAVRKFGENILVLGKVMHSQRLNEDLLEAWFIARENGEILCGHCKCIAGLSETCSHLGAMMYAIEDEKTHTERASVTGVKAYWRAPSGKVAEPMRYSEVLQRREKPIHTSTVYPTATKEELHNFLRRVKDELGIISPIMTVTRPFSLEIAEEDRKKNPLTRMYEVENSSLSLEALRKKADEFELSVTPEDCKKVEESTRGQSDNRLWFQYRTGRITASKFKNACCTKVETPAISTIKNICYPNHSKFVSKQTEYGCSHEKDALEAYIQFAEANHRGLAICTVGLVLSPAYPHFGASPDAIVSCDCCGHGCVEVKCPFCAKDTSVAEALPKYLKKGSNYLQLNTSHAYYYQIQMQMAICNKDYCDFVVWSEKDIYIERVLFNSEFWDTESAKASTFWRYVILPELLGKYYTTRHLEKLQGPTDPQPSTSSASDAPKPTVWCICRQPDDNSRMIKCDNNQCPIEWFHMRCLNMKRGRKIWLCDKCKPSGSK